MTMFEKEKFTWDGMYLMYVDGENRSFVARFKRRKNYKSYINFPCEKQRLRTETYFNLTKTMAPLEAMWALGFKKT
jgi:hypothetical protein